MKPKIKVCGITREEDARLAEGLGAWALGFIFYPASPRYITPERAKQIIGGQSVGSPKTVGVFVDASIDAIRDMVEMSGIDTIQLHGDETPDDCARLRSLLPGKSIIKAFRLRTESELQNLARYSGCDALLLDSYVPGVLGGSGIAGDWSLAQRAQALSIAPVILAGGLGPDNIGDALAQVNPFAVDVSSGLEHSPGVKSAWKMHQFFGNALKVMP